MSAQVPRNLADIALMDSINWKKLIVIVLLVASALFVGFPAGIEPLDTAPNTDAVD